MRAQVEMRNTDNWRNSDPCSKWAKGFTELCSSVLCEVGIASDSLAYFSEKISKQSVEAMAGFLLAAYGKMQWTDDLRELMREKEPKCGDLGTPQPVHVAKTEKACSGANTKGMTGLSLDKAIIG